MYFVWAGEARLAPRGGCREPHVVARIVGINTGQPRMAGPTAIDLVKGVTSLVPDIKHVLSSAQNREKGQG